MLVRLHRQLCQRQKTLLSMACLACAVYVLLWTLYGSSSSRKSPKFSKSLENFDFSKSPQFSQRTHSWKTHWHRPETVAAPGNASAVREMARFAWRGYVTLCALTQGGNELAPSSNSCSTVSDGLVGPNNLLTVIDSLDTLILMGLTDEFEHGRYLVQKMFSPWKEITSTEVNVFETTIRILGGLLGAFTLSQDPVFAHLAAQVGETLAEAFADGSFPQNVQLSSSGLAKNFIKRWREIFNEPEKKNLAEVGSLYLEFAYLAEITNDRKFLNWVTRNQRALMNVSNIDGVFPVHFTVKSPWQLESAGPTYSAGAYGDSFYEYLVKRCLFDVAQESSCISTFTRSLDGIMKHLTVKTANNHHTCIMKIDGVAEKRCTMEHLTCFAGGMYVLAYLQNRSRTDWLAFAENVTETCYLSYTHSPTGLGPEIFTVDETSKKFVATDDRYILRPETVESIYYLYHVTGKQKYRDWGWRILMAINSTARTATGFSGLKNMTSKPAYDDNQWSFFMAETLKYLYLLFSPTDNMPMSQWLFTTEAHIIPSRENPMRQQLRLKP